MSSTKRFIGILSFYWDFIFLLGFYLFIEILIFCGVHEAEFGKKKFNRIGKFNDKTLQNVNMKNFAT